MANTPTLVIWNSYGAQGKAVLFWNFLNNSDNYVKIVAIFWYLMQAWLVVIVFNLYSYLFVINLNLFFEV